MLANNPAQSHTSFSGFTQNVRPNPEVFLSLHVKLVAATNRQRGGQKQKTYPHPQNHPAAKTALQIPPNRSTFNSFKTYFVVTSFLSVDLLAVSSLGSFQTPSLLPLSVCLTPPCGSVEGGALLVMSCEECGR